MNFMEALKTGKQCQTKDKQWRVIYIKNIMKIELQQKSFNSYRVIEMSNNYLLDFAETDWEVVDDDKDWNLAENYSRNYTGDYHDENVKKCRDLILQDVDGLKEVYAEHILTHAFRDFEEIINKRFGDL